MAIAHPKLRWIVLMTAVAATLPPNEAAAAGDSKAQCIAAYEHGQKYKQESKLSDARQQLLVCMRDACPEMLRNDCEQWLKEVDQSMPSVVIDAKSNGADVTNVKVTVDGKVVAERLDGKAIPLDPGDHVFVFESEEGPTVERKVLVRIGEKHRPIHVTFGEETKTAQKLPASKPIPALTWVFGGLGVVALGSFAYFGATGKSEADDYQKCKPYCAQSDVDSTRTKLIAADVSLGIGVVSLGIATVLLLTRPEAEPDTSARVRVHAAPLLGGGIAGVSSTF